MSTVNKFNAKVAEKLDEVAHILETQHANPFRVGAYRRAAETVRETERSLADIVSDQGIAGLDNLPGIGNTLARLLFQLVTTGALPMLERLRGTVDPVSVLTTIPGIGKKYAETLHSELGIDSLEELEVAAYDGRLAKIGLGAKRISGIRDSLFARLGRIRGGSSDGFSYQPSVAEILDVDREYREKAAAEILEKIAPRRHNPERRAWLPILHTTRGKHNFTALFSNTARAHELHKTESWVVIYFETDHSHRQYTVVTGGVGDLAGRRIVRGRERECGAYYSTSVGKLSNRNAKRSVRRDGRLENLYDEK
ncbi:MAG: DNA-binding protein [Chloracidobacterium sp.]|nr:DNA-binding protein [Chloracidobacterium sp.]